MAYIIIPFLAWLVSQTLKFLIRVWHGKGLNWQNAVWTYLWAGGPPSSHSAIVSSALYLVWLEEGGSAVFVFCFVAALIVMFNLVEGFKKEQLFEQYLKEDREPWVEKIFNDGKLLDISGHRLYEIFFGVLVGLVVAILSV